MTLKVKDINRKKMDLIPKNISKKEFKNLKIKVFSSACREHNILSIYYIDDDNPFICIDIEAKAK